MRLRSLLLFLLFLPLPFNAFAQTTPLTGQAKISLLTCGPGDELYSVFGHTALRINDPGSGMDVVCNFGTFDFDTPNFYMKFVQGDLQYMLSVSSYDDFVYTYRYYNRDVFEQELNLDPTQKQRIATDLAEILGSDRRFYTYKFINRNCTTMVADLINKYGPATISMDTSDKGKSSRQCLYECMDNSFYENLGINLLFGYKTDSEMDRLFLPHQLMEGVANTKTPNGLLAKPAVTVYKSTSENKMSLWNNYYTYAAICLLLMITSRNTIVSRSYLALAGLLGTLFCAMGLLSMHSELMLNYNALLFSPVFLLLLGFIFAKKRKTATVTAWICLASTGLYVIMLLGKPHFVMMLPLTLLTIIILLRIIAAGKKNRRQN